MKRAGGTPSVLTARGWSVVAWSLTVGYVAVMGLLGALEVAR